MGEYRRSREGTPGQTCGTPESILVVLQFALLLFGISLTAYLRDLDVSIAEVVLAVGYLCRLRLLRVHRCGRNHLGRLSVPDTPIRPASEAPTLGKEIHRTFLCLVEALKPRAVTLLHRRIKQLKQHRTQQIPLHACSVSSLAERRPPLLPQKMCPTPTTRRLFQTPHPGGKTHSSLPPFRRAFPPPQVLVAGELY